MLRLSNGVSAWTDSSLVSMTTEIVQEQKRFKLDNGWGWLICIRSDLESHWNEDSARNWRFVYLFDLKCDIFTEVILWCGVICRRKEINVQNHNERTDQSVGESCVHHNCLEVTRPLMNGSMSPSRTEFKSDNWIPVLRSWTNFWGPNVYLRVSELHLSSIACLLISFMSDTLNSLATRRSFAFNLLVAFSLFAK
jgi:hypothetical protein